MSKEDEKYFADFYKNWKQKNPAPPKRTTVAKKDPETKKKVLNTPAVVKTKAAATKTPCIPCDKENSAPPAAPAIAPPVVVNPIDSTDDSDKKNNSTDEESTPKIVPKLEPKSTKVEKDDKKVVVPVTDTDKEDKKAVIPSIDAGKAVTKTISTDSDDNKTT